MKLEKIRIAGAGTMGYSIAEIFSEYGYDVTLYDVKEDALLKAKEYIDININSLGQEREKMSEISFTNRKDCFQDADLVIECIIENLQIKHTFYKEISEIVKDETILATNTSGLSINEIAKAVYLPERLIGMHWFNPSNLVRLIEIIKGDATKDEVVQSIHNLCLAIHKKPVIVQKDVPGFVGNRIQFAILREVLSLIEAGVVDAEGIDDVMKYGLGFRYACAGPLQIADFGGLDTFHHISEYLMQDLNAAGCVPPLLEQLYQEGNYGVKTGKGFFDYGDEKGKSAIEERNVKMLKVFNALYSEERE